MRAQSKGLLLYQICFALGVIALFAHMGADLVQATRCSTDYSMAHHLPPPNNVVVTVDGQVVSDRYAPVEPDAHYLQLMAEAGARFQANGCNASDFERKP